ncbi:uncharacterized protein LOC105693451 [Athalia rosae]|uniref:uncharacterized protein LOC105693451 n=1 Tax=Athalia rosae TaxID=37344 RepID=UPI002033C31B|nr:uncharacterized protein LOC105693451 [Athalia rosae]XP_048505063.1 uncharacterized protein LOC105693451 [Athalia rosae]
MECKNETVRLSLDTIKEIIAKDEPDVEIVSFEEEPGSGRGDNYTSMLYRLRVMGMKQQKNTTERVKWQRAIIYKVLPDSRERREAFKSETLFRNEVAFYTRVWPALNALQSRGRRVFDGVARIYTAREDLIAMEDLRERGFQMGDRRVGLQLEQLQQTLSALAGFHALSLALKELRPEKFEELSRRGGNGVEEAMFRDENADWYRQYYRVAANNAIKMVSEALPPMAKERREDVMQRLQTFLHEDTFFHTMSKLAAAQGPLTVFCHGDCWTNNILFREESGPDSKVVCFVDFQLSRVGSLALDLANLLYCCTSGEVRRVHMTSLLRHYHLHLIAALEVLDVQQSSRDPATMWNVLTKEIWACGRFGLGLALDMLPISTCASDEAPNLYEDEEASEKKEGAQGPPPGGAECARLMTDLVLELIDNEAL